MLPENYKHELYHYGVLGMKWGVRRGKTEKAYAKASKKLNKLDKKVTKAEFKSHKKMVKVDKSASNMFVSDRRLAKRETKAKRAASKAAVRNRKAERWYKSMEKTFANTDISLTSEQIAMGQRYVENLNIRTLTYR